MNTPKESSNETSKCENGEEKRIEELDEHLQRLALESAVRLRKLLEEQGS